MARGVELVFIGKNRQHQFLQIAHVFTVIAISGHDHGRHGVSLDGAGPRIDRGCDFFLAINLLQAAVGGKRDEMKTWIQIGEGRHGRAGDKNQRIELAGGKLLDRAFRRVEDAIDVQLEAGEQSLRGQGRAAFFRADGNLLALKVLNGSDLVVPADDVNFFRIEIEHDARFLQHVHAALLQHGFRDEAEYVELHDRQIDLTGTEQVDIVEGTVGLNDFDRQARRVADLFDVLRDAKISSFRGTGRDGQGPGRKAQQKNEKYHDESFHQPSPFEPLSDP